MTRTTVHFLRHGEVHNPDKILYGRLPSFRLSDDGLKMAYDFFQEERIPTDLGMAQGRSEAILDETRQLVRELREEIRSAIARNGSGAPSTATTTGA